MTVFCHAEDVDSWVTTAVYAKFDMCDVPQSKGDYITAHYLTAVYWVIATVMAVGYGDIYAQNPTEMAYSIVAPRLEPFCYEHG